MLKQLLRAVMAAAVAFAATPAAAQDTSAGQALFTLLDRAGTFTVLQGTFDMITTETTTFPVSSPASGFVWNFNPSLGVPTRRSESFGPMFAQRPMTTGAHELNVGLTFQHTAFDSLGGQSLASLQTSGIPTRPDTSTLSLDVNIDRYVASATYGISRHIDIGVVVPFGRSVVSGTESSTVFGRPEPSVTASGSSSGIGDVSIQGKVELPSVDVLDLAAGVDLRLPTGDKEKLLGTGTAQTKLMIIGATAQRVAPHFNVGYLFGGGGFTGAGGLTLQSVLAAVQPSPEFDYTVGVDAAVTQHVTIAGDVIGRQLRNSVDINLVTTPTYSEFQQSAATVNLVLGAITGKVHVGGLWLITGSVLFPVNKNGLVPRVTPVFGLERAF